MIDISGEGAEEKVRKGIEGILQSNPRGFSWLNVSEVFLSKDRSKRKPAEDKVEVRMHAFDPRSHDFLAERSGFFEGLLKNRFFGRRVSVSFTRNSFL